MKDDTRRAVAFIAGRLIDDQQQGEVYDHQSGQHHLFSGRVTPQSVMVFDQSSGSRINGDLKAGSFNLEHSGTGKPIVLDIVGSKFSGADHACGRHFRGTVSNRIVLLFDYETNYQYKYTC